MAQARLALIALSLIKFIIPFYLQSDFYQPHRDEFLYLVEADHLDWGYLEVPPLLSVFSWVTDFFGSSMFYIKLWPSLFGALTYYLTGSIILSLGGKVYALLLAFLPFVFGVYLRVHFLFQPNFLEIFFYTAIAYSLVRYFQSFQNKWLYVFGLSAGLGMLSKYSIAFFIISVVVALAFTGNRSIFKNRHFYFSGIFACLIFLPNFLWQYIHRFPVINHMNELQETQLQYISPLSFLADQLLMNLPTFFIWIAGLYYVFSSPKGKKYSFLGIAYFLLIFILIVMHGKNYYSLGAYPYLFAFGALHLENWVTAKAAFWKYVMVLFAAIIGIILLPMALPIARPARLAAFYKTMQFEKSGLLKWEDLQNHSLPQDFADMIGWKETAEKVSAVYHEIPESEQKQTLIYCRSYGMAGALNLYASQFNLPEVHSDNGTFLLWMPDNYNVKHLIFIGHSMPDSADIVFEQFDQKRIVDSLNYPMAREHGIKIIVYKNGNAQVDSLISAGIHDMKSKFTR